MNNNHYKYYKFIKLPVGDGANLTLTGAIAIFKSVLRANRDMLLILHLSNDNNDYNNNDIISDYIYI